MLRSIFIKMFKCHFKSTRSRNKKRKRIGFYSRYLFYSLSLHAFQVSTQIDFLITQTYFTSFTTTKNGFDMTKEKLTAFLTTKLTFELLLYEILFSPVFYNLPKIKAITFFGFKLLTFCSNLCKIFKLKRKTKVS